MRLHDILSISDLSTRNLESSNNRKGPFPEKVTFSREKMTFSRERVTFSAEKMTFRKLKLTFTLGPFTHFLSLKFCVFSFFPYFCSGTTKMQPSTSAASTRTIITT